MVDLNASTAANVKVRARSLLAYRVDNNWRWTITRLTTMQGNRLVMNAVFERAYQWNPNPYVIVISCPTLTKLTTGASYRADNTMVTDTIVREDWNMRRVTDQGIQAKIRSERQTQDYGSTVVLAGNTIRSLRAVIGKSNGSGSKIILQRGNEFGNAVLDIGHRSVFLLENATIQNLSYHLADSAELIVTGSAQHLLNKTKPYQP